MKSRLSFFFITYYLSLAFYLAPVDPIPLGEPAYNFAFLDIYGDKTKEIVLFFPAGGEGQDKSFSSTLKVLRYDGTPIGSFSFPKEILFSFSCSTALYVATRDTIYRLTFQKEQIGPLSPPRVEGLVGEEIDKMIPIPPQGFALITPEGLKIYTYTAFRLSEIAHLPLAPFDGITSIIRDGNFFYIADCRSIFKYDIQKSRLKRRLNLRPVGKVQEKLVGIFTTGEKEKIITLSFYGKDLYLATYSPKRNSLSNRIPLFPVEDKNKLKVLELPPYLIIICPPFLFSCNIFGVTEQIGRFDDLLKGCIIDLDGDNFLDLACLQKKWVQIFINQRKKLLTQQKSAIEDFLSSLKRGERTDAERYLFLAYLFNDILGADESKITILRRKADIAYFIQKSARFARASLFFILPLVLFTLLLKREKKRKRRIALRSVPEIVNLAYEVITIDHNFLIKDNIPAAKIKMENLRKRYRLLPEELSEDFWQKEEYKKFLRHFLSSPYLKTVAQFIGDRLQELRGGKEEVVIGEGVEDCLLYIDPGIEGVFAHIFSDHFRYRQAFSKIEVSYIHTTDWSRRIRFSFFSDAPTRPNLLEGHLAEDLAALSQSYGKYLSYGEGDAARDEKLWVAFLDIPRIIKGIIERLE